MASKQLSITDSAPFRLRNSFLYVRRKKFQVKRIHATRAGSQSVDKEREWRRLKTDYESYIMALEAERDGHQSRDSDQPNHDNHSDPTAPQSPQSAIFSVTLQDEALKNQTKAVLLAELVSMELFYGLEDLLREDSAGFGKAFPTEKLYGLTDRDLLLHSAETLLELTEYFFTKSTLYSDDATRTKGLGSTDTPNEKSGRTSRLMTPEECGRHSTPINDSSYTGKLLRVRETLCRLKKTTDSAALSFFSSLFDSKLQENGEDVQDGKRRLHELLQDLLKSRKSSPGDSGHVIDSWKLEQSLCHVLMDKALLNCLFLLDKADMESRIKTYKMQQSRFDYSGFSNMTPVQLECCSQSGDEIPPSPPLPRGRAGEGRLTSVDEGVVLESSSDSANSREKLTAHFENAVEELEAENKLLCEKNEEAENEKSELTLKVLELERKLKRSEQKLAYLVQLENSDEVELRSKVEEKEFESQELFARVDELEDELHVSERTVSSLRESERRMLLEEKRRAEAGDEQRAKLHLKIRQLEDKLEESELKLASYTGSDFLENNKITKQLESAIAENTELNVRILHLEEKLKESGNVSTSEDYLHCDEDSRDERRENQTRTLERKILDLEGKLKEQDVKIASVKEYERRLRAELCKEMTKKLTRAQTRSRDLGEKILELEARLRDAEQQCTRVRGLDTNSRNVMSEDVRVLTSKLQDSETRNRELSLNLQEVEERYRVSQDNALIIKQSESNLREKVQWLELENCKLQEKVLAQKEKSKREPCSSRTAGRLEKVRNENSNLAAELKSFRENLLNLEGQLLAKDQVILSLRNDSVDLSSESSELRAELDASLRQKVELERELARYVKGERELVVKLDRMQDEVEKLRADVDAAALSNVTNVTVTNDNDKDKRVDTDCRSDSTSSTLLIGEKNAETSVRTPNRNETFTENVKSEKSVEESSSDVDKLLKENKSLLIVVDELGTENSRITRENERLLHEIRTLETNLSVVEKTFGVCRAENDCLLQEINLKSAEATTVRTYASFCSEETKKLKSELATHRRNEAVLEKRLTNLESESLVMRNEMGRGISEFSDLRENKDSLEKRILEASRVVDQLKQEILSLTKGMLTLQKETNTQVDKIMLCLGLDEKRVALSRVRHGQRPESVDSNCTSTQTEGSSDEISSEMSESHARKWSFSCHLLPDEECFINPSDVSVMRENKSEIRNLHEELRSKMLAVKDALSRVHGVPLCNSAADLKEENGRLGMNRKSEVKIVVESEALRSGSKGGVVLPRLSKAERVKLSSLLTTLKEELIREKERNYVAQLGCDDNDICSLYDNLESKLSRLSCELATKEDEISDLLAERTLLEEELDACEKGLGICRHCSAKVPDSLEDRRTQLKGSLLAHMQETSRLEGEIFEFMEYRQRLEGELSAIKSQITDLEEELDVRKILIERCIGFKPSRDESDSSKDDTDTLGSSSPGKKRKSQKHVTFESVDSELEDSKRRRQKPDKCHAPYSEDSPGEIGHWRATDLDSSDLDLCELLNSIPRDVPKKLPTREELEIAECANRLSAYDNMSFNDKVVFATERRKSETDSADGRAVKRVLFNGGEPACNGGGIDKVGVDYGDDGAVSCQLCGLFRKRS